MPVLVGAPAEALERVLVAQEQEQEQELVRVHLPAGPVRERARELVLARAERAPGPARGLVQDQAPALLPAPVQEQVPELAARQAVRVLAVPRAPERQGADRLPPAEPQAVLRAAHLQQEM
jgi:hypothetical protein